MSQQQRNVGELIRAAFILIGEYEEGDTLNKEDYDRGFSIINLIVESLNTAKITVPYLKTVPFTLEANKRDYLVSSYTGLNPDILQNPLVGLEYCNIRKDDLVWPCLLITQTQIRQSFYNPSLRMRPNFVLVHTEQLSSTLTFFPTPDQEYNCEIRGKFQIGAFDRFTDIDTIPLSGQNFLIYALARELIAYYPSGNWAQTTEDRYQELKEGFKNVVDIDYMVQTSGMLRRRLQYYQGGPYNIIQGG